MSDFNSRLRNRLIKHTNQLRNDLNDHIKDDELIESEWENLFALYKDLGKALSRSEVALRKAKESREVLTGTLGLNGSFDDMADSAQALLGSFTMLARAEGVIYVLENAPDESARAALQFVGPDTIKKWREIINDERFTKDDEKVK